MQALLIVKTAKGIGPGKTESPNITVAPGETEVRCTLDPNNAEYDDPALLITLTIERFDEAVNDWVFVSSDTYPGGFRPKGGLPSPGITYPPKATPQNFRVSVTTNKAVSLGINGETK